MGMLLTPDLGKFGRPEQLHAAFQGLAAYAAAHGGSNPPLRDATATAEVVAAAKAWAAANAASGVPGALALETVDEAVVAAVAVVMAVLVLARHVTEVVTGHEKNRTKREVVGAGEIPFDKIVAKAESVPDPEIEPAGLQPKFVDVEAGGPGFIHSIVNMPTLPTGVQTRSPRPSRHGGTCRRRCFLQIQGLVDRRLSRLPPNVRRTVACRDRGHSKE
jgi:hypothetical protein